MVLVWMPEQWISRETFAGATGSRSWTPRTGEMLSTDMVFENTCAFQDYYVARIDAYLQSA